MTRKRRDIQSAWKHSSVGRASALQAEGHRFEPYCFHHYGPVVQLVRTLACHARGQGFESPSGRHFASVAQLVEQGTENPRVVGSIPTGGTIRGFSSFGRARPCQGRGGGFEPRNPLHFFIILCAPISVRIRRHGQAVRQRSATPLSPVRFRVAPPEKKHVCYADVLFSAKSAFGG